MVVRPRFDSPFNDATWYEDAIVFENFEEIFAS